MVACDLDGTLSAAPAQLGCILRALRTSGCRVVILTGTGDGTPPTPQGWQDKVTKLTALGCSDCWDDMVLFAGDPTTLADEKAAWCQANGVQVLIDNTRANAKAATAAGVPLALVPWASRV